MIAISGTSLSAPASKLVTDQKLSGAQERSSTEALATNSVEVRISDESRLLQAAPVENTYDPHHLNIFGEIVDIDSLPVQTLTPDQVFIVTDEASFKARIKEDFNRIGVYVDDAYVNAFYDCVTDINWPGGRTPDMDLPDPPDWWTGYRPIHA